ncbi:Peptidase inhibitor 15 [Parelaphostrongylus tenuis]|uniref:Peptidase inhibitor 15 n=1 Tax=Parelaphostrongylus tenuis TaxID=148309 RepID=A0AAD5QLJ9_PARTN|nr:Peptidase inhibitor 15 [Parelaphostrongylus tenuis]
MKVLTSNGKSHRKMNTIAALLLLLVAELQSCISTQSKMVPDPPQCSGSNMTKDLRATARRHHNRNRKDLARGKLRAYGYPEASNMSYMEYDCSLEKASLEVAMSICDNTSHHDFQFSGINIATISYNESRPYPFNGSFNVYDVRQIVEEWWKSGAQSPAPSELKPNGTRNDTLRIPFLQMADAAANKLGCAFHICSGGNSHGGNVSFVCKYAPQHVSVGVALYEKGEPCSACGGIQNSSCIGRGLCNNTDIHNEKFC